MIYAVVEASASDICPLASSLGEQDRDLLAVAGLTPRRAIRNLFNASSYRRAAIIGGRPVALWGLTGTLLDDEGEAWLVLSDKGRALPASVCRVAMREIGMMVQGKRQIRSSIFCRDARALKFARFLGFETTERRSQPAEHFAAILRGA